MNKEVRNYECVVNEKVTTPPLPYFVLCLGYPHSSLIIYSLFPLIGMKLKRFAISAQGIIVVVPKTAFKEPLTNKLFGEDYHLRLPNDYPIQEEYEIDETQFWIQTTEDGKKYGQIARASKNREAEYLANQLKRKAQQEKEENAEFLLKLAKKAEDLGISASVVSTIVTVTAGESSIGKVKKRKFSEETEDYLVNPTELKD